METRPIKFVILKRVGLIAWNVANNDIPAASTVANVGIAIIWVAMAVGNSLFYHAITLYDPYPYCTGIAATVVGVCISRMELHKQQMMELISWENFPPALYYS